MPGFEAFLPLRTISDSVLVTVLLSESKGKKSNEDLRGVSKITSTLFEEHKLNFYDWQSFIDNTENVHTTLKVTSVIDVCDRFDFPKRKKRKRIVHSFYGPEEIRNAVEKSRAGTWYHPNDPGRFVAFVKVKKKLYAHLDSVSWEKQYSPTVGFLSDALASCGDQSKGTVVLYASQ